LLKVDEIGVMKIKKWVCNLCIEKIIYSICTI